FSFEPAAVCTWAASLPGRGIHLPVHVGIAGPTPLPRLIRFAMQCGVGASLRSLGRNLSVMNKMSRLAAAPDEMLVALVRGCAAQEANLVRQPHVFSFGGA